MKKSILFAGDEIAYNSRKEMLIFEEKKLGCVDKYFQKI
jgi:hypothetical protein